MAIIKTFNNTSPQIHEDCWLAENAVVTGDVHIGAFSSLFYHAVIRGDVNKIRIGERVNIQDHSMIHGSYGKGDTIIGNDVTIGHRCIIHGCTIHDRVLVGMGAIILDDAIIEENVIIGAGALVTSGKVLKSGYLYTGFPAKQIKPLTDEMIQQYIDYSAAGYVKVSQTYKKG